MEEASLSPPYALVTAAESLHWMDWEVVLPRFRDVLAPGGVLAIVGRIEQANPWWPELLTIIQAHSTNRDFQPYNLLAELEARTLFHPLGRKKTAPMRFEQAVDDYIESVHSRNGFSRDRMTPEGAAMRSMQKRVRSSNASQKSGALHFEVAGSVVWGQPAP